jgi:hypothetical protein
VVDAVRQLKAARDRLESQRKDLLAQLEAARAYVPPQPPKTIATGLAAPAITPEPISSVPLLPGNSRLPSLTAHAGTGDTTSSQKSTTLPAVAPFRPAPIGTSALGGQPLQLTPSQPRTLPRIGIGN